MKIHRRHVLGTIAATAGVAVFDTQAPARADETSAAEPSAVGNPCLFNPDTNIISVVWRVHQHSAGAVEYGTTEQLGQTATVIRHGLCQRDDDVLMVHLQDLEPDTTYHYRTVTMPMDFASGRYLNTPARGPIQRSDIRQFRTLSAKSDAASFAVINDTHENTPIIHGLFERLAADPADSIIWNGDLFNNVQTKEIVTEQTIDLLGSGEYASRTPITFVYGNHDIRAKYAPDLEKIFPTRDGRRYFTWRNGPIQFMALDTGEVVDVPDVTSFPDYRSEQIPWIAEQIKRPQWKAAPFRVVFCHIPLHGPYSSADARAKWDGLLNEGKVDLVISGHTHKRAYYPPANGRTYALLVGGGPTANNATLIQGRAKGRQLDLSIETYTGRPAGKWTFESRT
ncbi:MAG: hypothetical protein GC162_02015 [Planctomycetes bacterium]|nr:hypothetical protein [Planctomycetota bacterium]